MRVKRLGWVGTRTENAADTVNFFKDVLGLDMEKAGDDFWVGHLPDGGVLEVFGPASPYNQQFTTGPVVGFVVDNLDEGSSALRRSGVEVFGPYRAEDGAAWVHFRAPDGRIYELTQGDDHSGDGLDRQR